MFALRRALVGTAAAPPAAAARRRAFASSTPSGGKNPWLSDKSLYPLIGITAVTCLLGAWYGPYYLYKSPENQTPMRRHTTGNFPQKEAHEKGPFDENMYKKSEELTKGIYAVTIKDKGTAKDEEAGRG